MRVTKIIVNKAKALRFKKRTQCQPTTEQPWPQFEFEEALFWLFVVLELVINDIKKEIFVECKNYDEHRRTSRQIDSQHSRSNDEITCHTQQTMITIHWMNAMRIYANASRALLFDVDDIRQYFIIQLFLVK